LNEFSVIFENKGVSFVSLQKVMPAGELEYLSGFSNVHADLINSASDFEDTAAIIEGLDLVVTVDTSVAHLAASLGKPTWVLITASPDWRWLLGRSDSPWYPSVKLYRQAQAGSWGPLLTVVSRDIGQA
jgi:ADP-heptose:LPS heptosyltransferase